MVSVENDKRGVCTFSRADGRLTYKLEILVDKSPLARCPTESTPLNGVGNQALLCAIGASSSESIVEVSGRARDSFFTIRLAVKNPAKAAAMAAKAQTSAVSRAAEQVAGSLY